MGNFSCRNKIHPVDEILSSGHSSVNLGSSRRHEAGELEMIRQLQDEGIEPRVREGGMSFEINLAEDKLVQKPPRRLAKLPNRATPEAMAYTPDEKLLIAEILREDKLAKRKRQARGSEDRVARLKAAKMTDE